MAKVEVRLTGAATVGHRPDCLCISAFAPTAVKADPKPYPASFPVISAKKSAQILTSIDQRIDGGFKNRC